jgi:preprotein translocase subunit YajC
MILSTLSTILALAPPPGEGQQSDPFFVQMFPLILMVVVFYLLFIRPQQRKAREHQLLLKTLRPGDRVLTNGGIVGVIITVKEKTVSLRSADTKLEILKDAVTSITERSGESE